MRDPFRAVFVAKQAVKLDPQNGRYLRTQGVASYRASDWKAAIAALEKSMALRKGGDSIDGFFLAMAHWRLGEQDKARAWYDRAVQWMDVNQAKNEELLRFRAEAAKLLEIKQRGLGKTNLYRLYLTVTAGKGRRTRRSRPEIFSGLDRKS